MIRAATRYLPLLALLAVTGCSDTRNDSPVAVSVIGQAFAPADPDRQPLGPAEATLIMATAQGLVRFDAAGQIEPGLSIRWAISDDGLSYTFRLGRFPGIDANLVARRLRARLGKTSHNPLKPLLGAIDEIVAVTPEVVEIRLSSPRANLLELLAQPEMAIIGPQGGTGPFAMEPADAGPLHLTPAIPHDAGEEEAQAAHRPERQVLLRAETAAHAIARFQMGRSDLVLGGRFTDIPLIRAARLRNRTLRIDPVTGLFGFAVVDRAGFIGAGENRRALAMALDRARIAAAFGLSDLQMIGGIVPNGAPDLTQPAQPGWTDADLATRRKAAADAVAFWRAGNPDQPARVRIAMPRGFGARLLFAHIRADWRAIGVEAVRVDETADAELRLIDAVAPSHSASWYLRRFTCDRNRLCSEAADAALAAARAAPDAAARSAHLADADLRLVELTPYIPIAQPLRWSLVNERLTAFQPNVRGVHPLNHLLPLAE